MTGSGDGRAGKGQQASRHRPPCYGSVDGRWMEYTRVTKEIRDVSTDRLINGDLPRRCVLTPVVATHGEDRSSSARLYCSRRHHLRLRTVCRRLEPRYTRQDERGMSQSQQKKKSQPVVSSKTQQSTTDRRQLVSTRTSPLIRVRFRNPIRTSVSGGSSTSAAGGSDARLAAASSSTSGKGGCGARRRRSADSASMSEEKADEAGTAMTTDDMGLEPRIRQYQKHELLQERSPDSGLSEVEAFLLEKQRLMELAKCPENAASIDENKDNDEDKLVPREPHYVPHPILQVKTETGLTELELYLKQKEAQLEEGKNAEADQQPAADATSS